jgi:hypothetical protein
MTKITIYLSRGEYEWVKSQGPGYLRGLVQLDGVTACSDIAKREVAEKMLEETTILAPKGAADNECPKCGYQLPYYGAKCKYCK